MDHSKDLDLSFSELYWSSFLDYVQKPVTETKRIFTSGCFRTKNLNTAAGHGLESAYFH